MSGLNELLHNVQICIMDVLGLCLKLNIWWSSGCSPSCPGSYTALVDAERIDSREINEIFNQRHPYTNVALVERCIRPLLSNLKESSYVLYANETWMRNTWRHHAVQRRFRALTATSDKICFFNRHWTFATFPWNDLSAVWGFMAKCLWVVLMFTLQYIDTQFVHSKPWNTALQSVSLAAV